MRNSALLAALLFLFGCAHSHPSDRQVDAGPAGYPVRVPIVLHAEDGEKILFADGRYVLLKATAESAGARELMMGSEAMPPGSAIPVHSHDGYEEILFVHEGRVRLTLGDRVVEAEAGTTMFVPPGTWHGVEAGDDDPATMLFIFPNPEIADFFRTVGFKEGEEPPRLTADDWAEIMRQHQMRARPAPD